MAESGAVRRRKIWLEFKQHDGGKRIQLGHGAACVSLVVEGRGRVSGIVLRPDEARALALGLRQQARFAEKASESPT